MSSPLPSFALVVPAKDVKAVKTLLETRGSLDKTRKIEAYTPDTPDAGISSSTTATTTVPGQKHLLVPVLSTASSTVEDIHDDIAALFPPGQTLYPLVPLPAASNSSARQANIPKNPLHAAFSTALSSRLPASLLQSLSLDVATLVAALPATYLVYAPLLLLPAHTFAAPPWQTLLRAAPADGEVMRAIWACVASGMGVGAVATNAAIPLSSSSSSSSSPSAHHHQKPGEEHVDQNTSSWNALRSPTGLTPLYGPFGARVSSPNPSKQDFDDALWVAARQNGVAQVWAPLYTMFSRGNVKEKARLLSLLPRLHNPSVRASPAPGYAERYASLDLYAGIGYFAFSHRRAGARPVLCWELNPWSVEGLRRGAAANGWTTCVVPSPSPSPSCSSSSADDQGKERSLDVGVDLDVDFIVFPHSNAHALRDLSWLSSLSPSQSSTPSPSFTLPPIRHANLGLLPSSCGSYRTAVRSIDASLGGWLHVHENFGAEEMEERAGVVVRELRAMWRERWEGEGEGDGDGVRLVHLEKVKTYAPGVWHVVLDIWIPPTSPSPPLNK
ncbi:S-adenosyl-L-methionine-dependent methyltransferase [Phyllosticta capitalensis]|uniref:tRNA(Phe) (4-demethylwyosine(37)-C(7)) aminocarboxypropyltransferase n=1 Tax=Phyllosticta capitalensis TaxID=121624 RepID=A0ABR1YRE4_9PEZI